MDYGQDTIQGVAGAGSFLEILAVTQDGCYQSIREGLIFPGWDGQSEDWCAEASWNWWINPVFRAVDPKVLKIVVNPAGNPLINGEYRFILWVNTWQESDYVGTVEVHSMEITFEKTAQEILYIDVTDVIDCTISGKIQEHVEVKLDRVVDGERPSDMDEEPVALFNLRTLTPVEADEVYGNGWVQAWNEIWGII